VTTSTSDAAVIVDTAVRSVIPQELIPGKVYSLVTPDGRAHKMDLTGDDYRETPARKSGTTTVRDVESFLTYFEKHADDASEVYADIERRTVTAVLDAHQAGAARWGKHRVLLELRNTAAWKAWTSQNDRLMPQDAFADFIEDNLVDLVEPDSATMLELAQSFEATTSAEFQSSKRLDSGQRTFSYVEDVQAKAGQRGDITIPSTLTLALRPFEGTEPYKVTARFKYRLGGGNLQLGFKLERPEDVLSAAFEDIRTLIDEGVPEEIAVLNGAPTRV
jgi:uncharacterized protein YfdQ (DUF2303 family)